MTDASISHLWCAGCTDSRHLIIRCSVTQSLDSHLEGVRVPSCARAVCVSGPMSGSCVELDFLKTPGGSEIEDINHAIEQNTILMTKALDRYYFVCPACWNTATKSNKVGLPYKPLLPKNSSSQADVTHLYMVNRRGLGFFNSLNLDRIGLIDISHSDFANFRISFQQLAAKIAEFDPKLPNRPSLQRQHTLSTAPGSYKRLVKGVHDVLSSGAQHVIVLITTHCDKHGQLAWAGIPELTVNKFLAQAFPNDLALKFSSISAHLILLCCSGIFRNQEAYDSLVQFAQRGIFQSIIAFPNEHQLQPYLTATFLLHWFQRIVRQQESYERALPGICLSVPEIGHHTHIFCAFKQPLGPVRFLKAIWCHRYRAPFGIQWQQSICKDCHCFNSLVFKRNRSLKQLQIQCKNSKHKQCKNRWLPIDGIFLDTPEGSVSFTGEWKISDYHWTPFDQKDFDQLSLEVQIA
ncbi:hypothetical protein EV361DRAFT_150861 [Lentinula raphanica]|uniref:Uncharacterized protein n=1 Tax=Lentinula raphanica TaxID=153919 RepID=A0AA38NZ95_9AGAR|nr:hypothetical protein F5878DRAFT_632833 [Lentinula raphanica]KAJ3963717.1 hypothetical protein EV361DRAFT_150861 [Lentinula raphanica]